MFVWNIMHTKPKIIFWIKLNPVDMYNLNRCALLPSWDSYSVKGAANMNLDVQGAKLWLSVQIIIAAPSVTCIASATPKVLE